MITEQDLKDQCECIQHDLDCVLDGIDDDVMTHVCQVVVDRFQILKDKLERVHQAR